MNEISIDIETRSSNSIKYGVYKYAESPDFKILLFAYSINGLEPVLIDLTARQLPEEVISMLTSEDWLKTAHNAQFERVCINKYFGLNIPVKQWACTMVLSASLSLPLPLDTVSKILKVTEKDRAGKDLIRYFCIPIKNPKEPGKVFHIPTDNPEKWKKFGEYCLQDVRVETQIKNKLKNFLPVNTFERNLYVLDQHINDYGVKIDRLLIGNAIRINKHYTEALEKEAKEITGVANPHSVAQLKAWIEKEAGIIVKSLNKTVTITTDNPKVKRLLELRKEMSKTSIKKYLSMYKAASNKDNRVRGLFQFGGASRTMRWAGRIAQPQNYPKNKIKVIELNFLRSIVKDNDLEFLKAYSGDINYTLSQMLRTSFIPEKGNVFLIDDFSAIEARVLSWYANEKWRLDVFKTHGKIYEASASLMFKMPIEAVKNPSPERDKGKVAELALGYQGGAGALVKMGADKMGLTEDEMLQIVYSWRKANGQIVKFWYDIERAVKGVISDKVTRKLGPLTFRIKSNCLLIYLPSGRPLVYLEPKFNEGAGITYMGMEQLTKKWLRLKTYGGKLVENIVQATARDLLANAMINIASLDYKIAMHIHDEVVIEVPRETAKKNLEVINTVMGSGPAWAKGLPLKGDGYLSDYYRKED